MLLVLGVAACILVLRMGSNVIERSTQVTRQNNALNLVKGRKLDPSLLVWSSTSSGPRTLEPFVADQIATDYLNAYGELAYAWLSQDTTGLVSYFQNGALDDVLASRVHPGSLWIDLGHRLNLYFYSPDGATVAFDDRFIYGFFDPQARLFRAASRTQRVVLQLDDGNWRIHHWKLLDDTSLKESLPIDLSSVRGINYQARSAPFDRLFVDYPPQEVASDLARIKGLGLGTVRFFIPFSLEPSPSAVGHLKHFLGTAKSLGLTVIPTLLDRQTRYSPANLPELTQVLDLWTPFLKGPEVLLIDLKNEPDLDYPKNSFETQFSLRFLAYYLREHSSKPITIGFSEPDPAVWDSLDVVSFHHYGTPQDLTRRIARYRTAKKPILIEEFGFHTDAQAFPDPHTEAEQAVYYRDILDKANAEHVGALAWTLYDLPTGDVPQNRSTERHLGVVQMDREKPSARVLRGMPAPIGGGAWSKWIQVRWMKALFLLGIACLVLLGFVVYKLRRKRVKRI